MNSRSEIVEEAKKASGKNMFWSTLMAKSMAGILNSYIALCFVSIVEGIQLTPVRLELTIPRNSQSLSLNT